SGTGPGVWSSTETTVTPMGPETGPPTGPATGPSASTSALGSGSRIVDCTGTFVADGSQAKAQADCRRAEPLWQAVFPGLAVGGARNPDSQQVANGFLARILAQDVTAPALYGRPQPQVVQDWTEALRAAENVGPQTWSGFDIATAQGTMTVQSDYRSGADNSTHLPCLGDSPCDSVPLGDDSVAEVSDTGDGHRGVVTVRAPGGGAYRISFTTQYGGRYADVPCSAPDRRCYADLTDGSIRPGMVPNPDPATDTPSITRAMLTDILTRPAFAALVQGYFAGKLGQPG
ncbi:hypothetical protein, partial [Catenulispora rubra]|uniref:hypothetical protein n=1 Tax=Catenulispora rubra TaxID=280293 RepID=UPI001E29C74D